MAIRVAQVVAEDIVQQDADIRVAQVVGEDVILQSPAIRVAQVIWEQVILPGVPITPVTTPFIVGGGTGCLPHCIDTSATCRAVESMRAENRGGDPAIVAAILAMLVVLEAAE